MSAIPIYFGIPWSPYLVFIKDTQMSDEKVLESLGLVGYVRIRSKRSSSELLHLGYIGIGRDSQWTHIADNYGYTHWHSKSFQDAVVALAPKHDLFTFSVGEPEMSFDLTLYLSGQLVRRFVWEDRDHTGGRLQDEFGPPLQGEDSIPRGKDPLKGLWEVA